MFSRNQNTNIPPPKLDTLFYNSVHLAKNTYRNKIACHVIKLVLLVAFLIVDSSILKSERWQLMILMRFGIAASVINLLINLIIRCVGYADNRRNNLFFTVLAEQVGHAAIMQRLQHPDDIRHLDRCVSSYIYNAMNGSTNNDPVLTPQIRNKYEKINKNLIQNQVLQNNKCLPLLDLLGRFFSFVAVIYGVVQLITLRPAPSLVQFIVLGIYIVLESINIWVIFLVILFIVFLPIICCGSCIYLCCCGSRMLVNREALSIPEARKADGKTIQQADGSCTICLQQFSLGDKVIVLTCSPKHVFHQKCIQSWLRVSENCPICRTPVPKKI